MDNSEYRAFQKLAERIQMSLGEWVRLAMRSFAQNYSTKNPDQKMLALRQAAEQKFPSGEIDDILSQINSGYTA